MSQRSDEEWRAWAFKFLEDPPNEVTAFGELCRAIRDELIAEMKAAFGHVAIINGETTEVRPLAELIDERFKP